MGLWVSWNQPVDAKITLESVDIRDVSRALNHRERHELNVLMSQRSHTERRIRLVCVLRDMNIRGRQAKCVSSDSKK